MTDQSVLSLLTRQRKARIPFRRLGEKVKENAQNNDLSHFQWSGTPSCRSFRTSPAGRRMGPLRCSESNSGLRSTSPVYSGIPLQRFPAVDMRQRPEGGWCVGCLTEYGLHTGGGEWMSRKARSKCQCVMRLPLGYARRICKTST
jgi:hypothetical protein